MILPRMKWWEPSPLKLQTLSTLDLMVSSSGTKFGVHLLVRAIQRRGLWWTRTLIMPPLSKDVFWWRCAPNKSINRFKKSCTFKRKTKIGLKNTSRWKPIMLHARLVKPLPSRMMLLITRSGYVSEVITSTLIQWTRMSVITKDILGRFCLSSYHTRVWIRSKQSRFNLLKMKLQ